MTTVAPTPKYEIRESEALLQAASTRRMLADITPQLDEFLVPEQGINAISQPVDENTIVKLHKDLTDPKNPVYTITKTIMTARYINTDIFSWNKHGGTYAHKREHQQRGLNYESFLVLPRMNFERSIQPDDGAEISKLLVSYRQAKADKPTKTNMFEKILLLV